METVVRPKQVEPNINYVSVVYLWLQCERKEWIELSPLL